jgi:ABC-2 type transport system permease protein
VAYVVLALVMILNGFAFRAALSVLENAPSEGSIVSWTFHAMWFWLSYFFIFPLLTMRLFAEEKKLGTLETLFTAPVRAWQVVGAKYLASVIVYCVLWLPSLFNFKFSSWISAGQVELPSGSHAGRVSDPGRDGHVQPCRGLLRLVAHLEPDRRRDHFLHPEPHAFPAGHLYHGGWPEDFRFHCERVNYFAATEHIRIFTAGLIDTRPLAYYLSMSLLFLAFTHHVVEFRRWRP